MKRLKKFLRQWGLFVLNIAVLLLWGWLSRWWAMALLAILLLCLFTFFTKTHRPKRPKIEPMPGIDNKIRALQDFQDSTETLVIELAKEYEAEILDRNTEEQLFQGRTAAGTQITPPYRSLTVTIKRAKGQPTNRVTLKDTGDFYRSFFVSFGTTAFAIGARDSKTGKIEEKYGKEIFGLDDAGQQEIIDLLRPDMIEALRKQVV